MLGLRLGSGAEPLHVLCLGAHADDIEIGCGGTLLRLVAEHPGMSVRWVVFSANAHRRAEAEASAAHFLRGLASPKQAAVTIHGFRDGFFPAEIAAIKESFEQLQREERPTLILTHFLHDLHQDHRIVAELTYNIFRDHLVWEYEIPKYDGDLGNPNLFLPLTKEQQHQKIAAILENFPSQRARHWFTADTFAAILRLRGIGCNAPSGFAEGFYCRKAVV
jgi:LmbE family N-acetylglucosaminyl deacetylase